MPQPDIPSTVGRETAPSVWWPTLWLALVLIVVKATYVAPSAFWDWATPRDYFSVLYAEWVAAASQADLLFALGAGLLAWGAIRATRRWPRAARMLGRGFIGFGIVCALYAVGAREFFTFSATPVTFQLLSLGGRPDEVMSSLEPFLTVPALAALFGAPLAYALLVWGTPRVTTHVSPRRQMIGRRLGVVVLVGWLLLGRLLLGSVWFVAQDRYIPDSPHWVLAESAALGVVGARYSLGSVDVRQEDVCELLRRGADTGSRSVTSSAPARVAPPPKNLILIVLESVGAQFLNVYGSKLATTPRLSAERNSSLIFDSYYTPVGWTAYSLYSIVLSLRAPLKGYDIESFTLDQSRGESLGNILSGRGYATAFMAAGDPDWASKGFFDGKGFQDVVHLGEVNAAQKVSSWGVPDHLLFDGMIDWIEKHHRDPFFLMAWTDQTHHPYQLAPDQVLADVLPPEPKPNEDFARYLTLVQAVDAQIGRLFDTLRARGLADNTLVAITGDHGEAFGQLRKVRGHGFTVYDEEMRVPLILWSPALFAGGQRSSRVGSHVDLNATLLDAIGVPAAAQWDGHSLLSPGGSGPAYLFAAGWGENLMGVREDNWKYIFDARQGREEMYDLTRDPDEQHNVVEANGDRAMRLRQRLAARWRVEKAGRESLATSCP